MESALQRFVDAIDDATTIVAHNADFDVGILKRRASSQQLEIINKCDVLCTQRSTTSFCRIPFHRGSGCKFPRLSELATKCDVDTSEIQLHMADNDVTVLKRCLLKLLGMGHFESGKFVPNTCGEDEDCDFSKI
jgi:DNA polymerase III epsilon subunit-like protein